MQDDFYGMSMAARNRDTALRLAVVCLVCLGLLAMLFHDSLYMLWWAFVPVVASAFLYCKLLRNKPAGVAIKDGCLHIPRILAWQMVIPLKAIWDIKPRNTGFIIRTFRQGNVEISPPQFADMAVYEGLHRTLESNLRQRRRDNPDAMHGHRPLPPLFGLESNVWACIAGMFATIILMDMHLLPSTGDWAFVSLLAVPTAFVFIKAALFQITMHARRRLPGDAPQA